MEWRFGFAGLKWEIETRKPLANLNVQIKSNMQNNVVMMLLLLAISVAVFIWTLLFVQNGKACSKI